MPDVLFTESETQLRGSNVTQVRGTLIGSSIIALKNAGHFEAYKKALPAEWHEHVLYAPAAAWLPIEIGVRHYEACNALGLSAHEVAAMGNAVAALTSKSVFLAAARVAREAGTSPLTVLPLLPRLWARLFQGGHLRGFQTGPKDVRMEVVGCVLLESPYFRNALRGLATALVEPVARKVLVREVPLKGDRQALSFLFSWV